MTTIGAMRVGNEGPKKMYHSRKDFVKEWTFPLHPLYDFEPDGEIARYAPGHPRNWGDEMHWLDFRKAIKDGQPEAPFESYYTAISHDRTLLAITSSHERILICYIESQELRQVLDGAGHLVFAPLAHSIDKRDSEGSTPAHDIICSATYEGSRGEIENQHIFWELDEQGRLLD